MKALVVFGSFTAEDVYGRRSGARVAEALTSFGWDVDAVHARKTDVVVETLLRREHGVVVPVGFGPPCEDGQVHALARMLGIPCAGPTPAQGGLMQDKSVLPSLLAGALGSRSGVRAPIGRTIGRGATRAEIAASVKLLPTPLIVKPAFSGSSEGLFVAETHEEAARSVEEQLDAEGKVVVQILERPEAEVSCTVLDGPDGPRMLPIVELRREDVLVMGAEEKFGSSANGRHIVPARLSMAQRNRIEGAVLSLCRVIGPVGLTRTDVLVLPDGKIVVLEVNGIPGLLKTSIACEAAAADGITFEELSVRYAHSAFLERPEPRMVTV